MIRTSLKAEQLRDADVIRACKCLARVERAFRSLKTTVLKVHPIFHWREGKARAHLLVWVDEALRSRLCESVPEGYLPHAEALCLTGVSRETLRQRIRNGRVETRWVRRGPGKGLYVRLELPSEPWLEGLEITADEPGLEPETDRESESA